MHNNPVFDTSHFHCAKSTLAISECNIIIGTTLVPPQQTLPHQDHVTCHVSTYYHIKRHDNCFCHVNTTTRSPTSSQHLQYLVFDQIELWSNLICKQAKKKNTNLLVHDQIEWCHTSINFFGRPLPHSIFFYYYYFLVWIPIFKISLVSF